LHQLDLCLISFGCQNSDRFVIAGLLAEQFDGGLVQAGGTEVLPEALKARAERKLIDEVTTEASSCSVTTP
jgi:hypothetical protein